MTEQMQRIMLPRSMPLEKPSNAAITFREAAAMMKPETMRTSRDSTRLNMAIIVATTIRRPNICNIGGPLKTEKRRPQKSCLSRETVKKTEIRGHRDGAREKQKRERRDRRGNRSASPFRYYFSRVS